MAAIRHGNPRPGPAGSVTGPRFRSWWRPRSWWCRHGRRRRLHEPRLSGQGHPRPVSRSWRYGLVGGLVALCGVFSYSELGAMFPRSSGRVQFPQAGPITPAFGFLAGWVSASRRLRQRRWRWLRWPSGNTASRSIPTRRRSPLAHRRRLAGVESCSFAGVRHSSTFQLAATALKVLLIAALPGRGLVMGTPAARFPLHPIPFRLRPHHQRAVRESAWCS